MGASIIRLGILLRLWRVLGVLQMFTSKVRLVVWMSPASSPAPTTTKKSQYEQRRAQKRAEAAQSDVRAAYGRYLPDLSATWMYDWQRMSNRGEMTETPDGYSAGLVLTIPLFDGFMRENAIRTARARQDQAKEQAALRTRAVGFDRTRAVVIDAFRSLDAIELKHRFTAAGLTRTIREAVRRGGFRGLGSEDAGCDSSEGDGSDAGGGEEVSTVNG